MQVHAMQRTYLHVKGRSYGMYAYTSCSRSGNSPNVTLNVLGTLLVCLHIMHDMVRIARCCATATRKTRSSSAGVLLRMNLMRCGRNMPLPGAQ